MTEVEVKKQPYNERVCGQCGEARRRRASDGVAYWFCVAFRRSCEKIYDECNRYKELERKVNGV